MAEVTRKSLMAALEETTVGDVVFPSSGADFVTLQDDFEMTPSFDVIENAELSPNVGAKADILGLEQPEFSFSHYIRASGTEATAPSFAEFVEGALGELVAAGTERDTVSGSTAGTASAAAVINVDTGEGVGFEKGEALLIKDATNGYSIRNVQSVSTDALTLGFNLAAAPGTGVNLGRAILVKPADTPPSLSVHLYRGNGAAYEILAGGRVSDLEITAEAGQPLAGSFTLAGTEYFFDPIRIQAADRYLDFTDDAGTHAAVVAAMVYKDPHDLAAALQQAMDDVTTTTPTVTYSDSTGKFTIKTSGTVLSILWNTGTNAANTIGDKIGFSTAANDTGTGATTGYTSDNAQSWSAPYTPTADASVDPLIVKAHEVMIGDFDDYGCAGVRSFTATITNELNDVQDVCETSGIAEKLLTARTIECAVVLNLSRHDADKFHRFHSGRDVRFAYNGGAKSGSNWVPGKCVNLYIPEAKITEYSVTDNDSVVTIEMTVKAYVKQDGQGEAFFNWV